jgi:energy-coupling factor transporter ATP-binding protein EcfA2
MPSRESRPTLTFESLTFSGGTTIALDPTDVVVLVGPNNAGKSAALRDITNLIGPPFEGTVVTSAKLRRVGTANELTDFIRRHSRITGSGPSACYEGDGFVVAADPAHIAASWSCHGNIRDLRTLFCRDLGTEFRIQDSNPVPAIGYQDSRVQPMHSLYFSDTLEERVSGYFRKAFGEDLIVFRLGGNTWPLLVGKKMRPGPDENILSKSYNDRVLNSTTPLVGQGDGMRSFASVILHLLTHLTPSILIIDEPEAYLHPPQARLLGEIIATETSSRVQVIMATHSPDVLQGLLNVAPERLRVLRILRSMNTNIIVELNRDKAKAISADPLMKSSNVLSGVFHKRVIIVESDADSMFYSALLDLEVVHGNQQPDVLFVHANGIHRMVTIVEALAALKVRVDVIVDTDILRQVGLFKEIVCALSGDWSKVDKEARYINNAIDQNAPKQDPARIKSEIKSILTVIHVTAIF